MLEELGQLTSELVNIDSINPDLVPGAIGEQRIADFVAQWLAARGVSVRLEEVRPGRSWHERSVWGKDKRRSPIRTGSL